MALAAAFVIIRAPTSAMAAEQLQQPLRGDFELYRFLSIVFLIALMAVLFVMLFIWQNKIEVSGYFGNIFGENMRALEFNRRSAPIEAKWSQGGYLDEFLSGNSARRNEWFNDNKNKVPDKHDDAWKNLSQLAIELDKAGSFSGFEDKVSGVEDSMKQNLYGPSSGWSGSGIGSLLRTLPPGLSAQGVITFDPTKLDQTKLDEFNRNFEAFDEAARKWTTSAKACLYQWYTQDLAEVRSAAVRVADLAVPSVDFSALRGQGPEFVLEFTAIIVIIFAAMILGIVGLLESNQIGTLLAAIAGYVLGKASSSTPASMPTSTTTVQGADGAKQATVQNTRAYSP